MISLQKGNQLTLQNNGMSVHICNQYFCYAHPLSHENSLVKEGIYIHKRVHTIAWSSRDSKSIFIKVCK